MSTCHHCERARTGAGSTFDMRCNDCRARCVARSHAAWNALHTSGNGDVAELVAMIGRVLPQVPEREAKRMVWAWWRLDHGGNAAAPESTTT